MAFCTTKQVFTVTYFKYQSVMEVQINYWYLSVLAGLSRN